jgi:hypothetical protein
MICAPQFARFQSFEFMGATFDRVGLGFRRGSDGLKGLRLVGSFPF